MRNVLLAVGNQKCTMLKLQFWMTEYPHFQTLCISFFPTTPQKPYSLGMSVCRKSPIQYIKSELATITHIYTTAVSTHWPFTGLMCVLIAQNVQGCRELMRYQPATATLLYCNYDKSPIWNTCLFMQLMNELALITYWNRVFFGMF